MKKIFFGFCFLCATAAFGQVSYLSNTPAPLVLADHPQRATEHAMRSEDNLLGESAYSYAQGERPLSDFGDGKVAEVPLGDIARAYRKEHPLNRKAKKVMNSD